jgi:acetylornithine deacetylase/succinyl-diaminopimelate desuccinylase-like protein
VIPGVTEPIAVIGTSEKGVTSLELRVEGRGGHASTPARLDPTARRVTQYFDEGESYVIEGLETDDEEDDEEDTGLLPPEPYFTRLTSGRRDKELPDVREFYPKE